MFDIQKMMDAMSEMGRLERGNYHLTLGDAIDKLTVLDDPFMPIVFDNGSAPGEVDSYRGYYSDLAFEPTDKDRTVADVLADLKAAKGATFNGYKGGDFVMGENTPLWAAPYGFCGPAVIGLTVIDGRCVLATKEIA